MDPLTSCPIKIGGKSVNGGGGLSYRLMVGQTNTQAGIYRDHYFDTYRYK